MDVVKDLLITQILWAITMAWIMVASLALGVIFLMQAMAVVQVFCMGDGYSKDCSGGLLPLLKYKWSLPSNDCGASFVHRWRLR